MDLTTHTCQQFHQKTSPKYISVKENQKIEDYIQTNERIRKFVPLPPSDKLPGSFSILFY